MRTHYERTTRKPKMIKTINHAKSISDDELLKVCADYFNELANGYYFEYEEVHFDENTKTYLESDGSKSYSSVNDFCNEIAYWLSCYYESGNTRYEDEYNDRKAFLKFLEVFKPYCEKINLDWIPMNKDTEFLFK